MSALLPLAAAIALALAALAAWRPPLACALLALAIPLTAGIERGTAVPLLRVNELLLIAVAAGGAIHLLGRRRPFEFTGLDVAVLAFCLVGVVVPWAVILLTRAAAQVDDWLVVVAPLQYLIVYLAFSRAGMSDADVSRFFHLCLLASIVVAAVSVLETQVSGVRDLVDQLYPTAPTPSWDPVYRPASLLGHYSAVGAFALTNILLALALAAIGPPGFHRWWLGVAMGANLLALISAQTYAPILVLPIGATVVLLVARRLPWSHLVAAGPFLAASAVVLWPSISARVVAQFPGGGGSGLPETLQTRIDYWQDFFVPALLRHGPWFGTGTLIPSDVPAPLADFLDNGYLWQLYRAGLPGLVVLAVMLAAVAAVAWEARRSVDTTHRVLGAVCLGAVVSLVLLDTTSEYLTFTAVSQQFWMLVGLLGAGILTARRAAAVPVVVFGARTAPGPRRLRVVLGRLAADHGLLRSSVATAAGFGVARALGFLFQVAAARVLMPDGFGRLGYALAVANIASLLLTTAPLGLSRFLARGAGDRARQEADQANWLALVGLVLGVSAVPTLALAGTVGLGGWMTVGLLANLLGVAALETYREVQRGLGRYALQSIFYVLANALQLVAVLVAAGLGARSPELYLILYGLSPVAALALLLPCSRGVRLNLAALDPQRLLAIASFVRPVLLQAVLWNIWFNADLLLLERLRPASDVGAYAAAKTIANGFTLIAMSVAFVLTPRIARLPEAEVRGEMARAVGLTASATLPAALVLALLAGPLTTALFGGSYAAAALPCVVLLAGMVAHGLKSVLGGLWLGLGRPIVEAASAGAGMVVTLALGPALVSGLGPVGAAATFSAGAMAQLLVDVAVVAWAFGGGQTRMGHLGDGQFGRPDRGWAVLAARARRVLVARRDWPRWLLWRRRLGYEPRCPGTARIEPVEDASPPEPAPWPVSDTVASVAAPEEATVTRAAARLLGLAVESSEPSRAGRLIDQALVQRWPLLAARAGVLSTLSGQAVEGIAAFVNGGGTLFVDGLAESSSAALAALGERVGFQAPAVRGDSEGRHLLLSGRRPEFGQELAGTRVESACGTNVLAARPDDGVLAESVFGGVRRSAVVERPAGRGRVVLSALADAPDAGLTEVLGSGRSASAMVAVLLLRQVYGSACWHAPVPLANLTIDDPALRRGMLGLRYDTLTALAGEHGFHVTVATVPRELELAEDAVVRRLRDRPDLLSACYHGCDHDGYEFYRSRGARLRYPVRPLERQRRGLRRAAEHGRRFTERHGLELDRVMVFPYGPGPSALLPDLRRLGFLASANYGDKYPLEAPIPADPDLGLRPADLAWEGFPLLWRRSFRDDGHLLDLVLGRPILLFAHPRDLGRDMSALVEQAAAVQRASGGTAAWRPLEEVARHAYLWRRDPAAGWRVLMTADEACLHNPASDPTTLLVERPHLPPGAALHVGGRRVRATRRLQATVPPGGTTVVRLATGDTPPRRGRRHCTIAVADPGEVETASGVPV